MTDAGNDFAPGFYTKFLPSRSAVKREFYEDFTGENISIARHSDFVTEQWAYSCLIIFQQKSAAVDNERLFFHLETHSHDIKTWTLLAQIVSYLSTDYFKRFEYRSRSMAK